MLDCITKDTSFRKLYEIAAFIWKVYQQAKNVTTSGIHFEIGDLLFVCVGALLPSQQFFNHVGMSSWILTSTKQRIKCLAQGHNTVPLVSLELMTLRSQV